ncbi:GLUG motif-containing protein, partial [Methylobacterium sp. WSM2598]|uniref:GLUG motif-containing protein n=1 Tax=Methylobacterium sp. WSM2598 TaxID=398261 RepID=UPI000366E042
MLSAWMLVNTAQNLQDVSKNLSGGYALGRDIDASETAGWNNGSGFAPLGSDTRRFKGLFDGQGRVITGLVSNRGSTSNIGLFGVVDGSAAVRNVGLVGGRMTGVSNVGGLVGTNYGSISQASASVSVTGGSALGGLVGANSGSITQASATGSVTSSGSTVGGLVGDNSGSISQAYATGSVTGADALGGLVGNNVGSISQAYATGSVSGSGAVGGLVGNSEGSISQAYATGSVAGSGAVGGLVGASMFPQITSSFWDTQTTGQGTSAGGMGTGLTTASARQAASYAGWNFTTDWYQAGDLRPIGRWEAAPAGADGVISIATLHQ